MESLHRVFGESVQEKLQKAIDIPRSALASIYVIAILGIRKANVDRLIKEDDVCMGIPAIGIERHIATAIRDPAWAKLEKKSTGGSTPRTAVQPQDKWCILWRIARLEEPVYQVKVSKFTRGKDEPEKEVLVIGDVEVSRVLLDERVRGRAP